LPDTSVPRPWSAVPPSQSVDFTQVTLASVSRYYGRRRALSQVNVVLSAGEIIGLLGPNGAGKSTLLGVLSTLAEPSGGEVSYGDLTASQGGAALRAQIGFLSHDLQLYPELTARENLEFFGGLYGLDRVAARATDALALANLSARADDVVDGFSRGMRQRLALERVLLHEPRLVLFDEPFTGLDEASCGALLARLEQLRAAGRIVVVATHDLDMVDPLLDRAVLLRTGRLRELGSSGSLRARYRAALAETPSRRPREPTSPASAGSGS
jgi:ABC-type multidrug transport system ATPase subunit